MTNKYLECGDLHEGFARIRCPDCHHEYLLAFSCRGRWFYPSCIFTALNGCLNPWHR
ncbi:transposase zinc-binding domain-containing protein [Desulfopila aestuarii]|uniref:transposase zinc-binding domain-containing protein n=1 Tax=Desulfopila aestuarii TaxID=231440 RepID=UPI001F3A7B93